MSDIAHFLDIQKGLLEVYDKYSHYKQFDLIDIRAFLGLLYLRARLKVNQMDQQTIWYHETDFFFF